MCCNDIFKLLLSTLLKELFTNKGGILLCIVYCVNQSNPSKTEKENNSQAYYTKTSNKSGSNSPPFQGKVQIPSSLGTMHSQMPRVCPGGGMLKFQFDWYITV